MPCSPGWCYCSPRSLASPPGAGLTRAGSGGAGLTPAMERKPTGTPIKNEAGNGLKNRTGTIAMARTAEIDSATSQFFINTEDNKSLDHGGLSPAVFGYAVFGKVVDGMDVVYTIEQVPTGSAGDHQDVPVEPVVITRVTVID